MKVLYLINYAGKAGIEKYVENLVRLGPAAGVEPYFAYAVAGPLSEKMAAAGMPSLRRSALVAIGKFRAVISSRS